MPSQHKKDLVKTIQDKVEKAKSLVIVDYSGTNANQQVELRSMVSEVAGEVFVTKNSLIKIALGKNEINDSLTGMNALVLSYDDAVSALKKVFEFHQEHNTLEIKKGFMVEDDKVLSEAQVVQLSKLPSKEELIVTLIQRVQGPAYGLVNVLKAGQRNLVYALQAIAEQKQAAAN